MLPAEKQAWDRTFKSISVSECECYVGIWWSKWGNHVPSLLIYYCGFPWQLLWLGIVRGLYQKRNETHTVVLQPYSTRYFCVWEIRYPRPWSSRIDYLESNRQNISSHLELVILENKLIFCLLFVKITRKESTIFYNNTL